MEPGEGEGLQLEDIGKCNIGIVLQVSVVTKFVLANDL